ncbi:MAG: class I SAM-dependent methyltransferase [Gammaproteobacteria bacterium]|nr:class I SAM-dependent methyltransferase [Gammaproteobacteria bacterium]
MVETYQQEISQGKRFAFGKNWQRFLKHINEARIVEAETSLKKMLNLESLVGKTFLDAGCGSGLFSLAAKRLGAKVVSFDFDQNSVGCANELKRCYFPEADDWRILQGSVLDNEFLKDLGQFDIVYSWGVLHHTGAMWQAISTVAKVVKASGKLYISIYNEQGLLSKYWFYIKKTYNQAPSLIKKFMECFYSSYFIITFALADSLRGRSPLARYRGKNKRGMTVVRDVVDWIGGWPFEVAKPEAIFNFLTPKGFYLQQLKTCGGKHGCNEFVFAKEKGDS